MICGLAALLVGGVGCTRAGFSSYGAADDGPSPLPQDQSLEGPQEDSLPDLPPPAPGLLKTIKGGSFTMGSPTSEPCRENQESPHQVTLERGFEIPNTEVTQAEFQTLMGYNPSRFAACGGSCPVEQVSWHEAVAYCNALSDRHSLERCYGCQGSGKAVTCQLAPAFVGKALYGCKGYRLPTEAEWEYAYRAGTESAFYGGTLASCSGAAPALNAIAWYWENSAAAYVGCYTGGGTCHGPHPVGRKRANGWELHDMAGNVSEWCQDWAGPYPGDVTDPCGPASGERKVHRGGSWFLAADDARAAHRASLPPADRAFHVGFRCVRSLLP